MRFSNMPIFMSVGLIAAGMITSFVCAAFPSLESTHQIDRSFLLMLMTFFCAAGVLIGVWTTRQSAKCIRCQKLEDIDETVAEALV